MWKDWESMSSEMKSMRLEIHDYPISNLRMVHNAVRFTVIIPVYVHLAFPTCLVNTLPISLSSPLVIGFLRIIHAMHFLRWREIRWEGRVRENSWTSMWLQVSFTNWTPAWMKSYTKMRAFGQSPGLLLPSNEIFLSLGLEPPQTCTVQPLLSSHTTT